jgi:hypothetical protein
MEIIDEQTVVFDCGCARARLSDDMGVAWNALPIQRCSLLSFRDRNTAWGAGAMDIKAMQGREETLIVGPTAVTRPIALAAVSAERAFLLDSKGTLHLAAGKPEAVVWETLPFQINRDDFIYEPRYVKMRFKDEANGLLVAYSKQEDRWLAFLTRDGGRTWKSDTLPEAKSGTCFISPDLSLVTVKSAEDDTIYLFQYRPGKSDA